MKSAFILPIHNVLDSLEDPEKPERSLLTRVICVLYERELTVIDIAASLGISEHTIYDRLPKDELRKVKDKEKIESLKPEVYKRYAQDGNPKAIAYDLGLSLHKVYQILKERKENDREHKDSK